MMQQQQAPVIRRNRSRGRLQAVGNNNRSSNSLRSDHENNTNMNNTTTHYNQNHNHNNHTCRSSSVYVLFSTFVALLAIVSPPTKKYYYYHQVVVDPTTGSNGSGGEGGGSGGGSSATLKVKHQPSSLQVQLQQNHHQHQLQGQQQQRQHLQQHLLEDNDHKHSDVLSSTTEQQNSKLLKYTTAEVNHDYPVYNSAIQKIINEEMNAFGINNNNNNPMVNLFGKKHNNNHNHHSNSISGSDTNIEKNVNNDNDNNHNNNNSSNNNLPPFIKWFLPRNKKQKKIESDQETNHSYTSSTSSSSSISILQRMNNAMIRILYRFIDPSLLEWIHDSISFDSTSSPPTTTSTTTHHHNNNTKKEKDPTKTATHIFDKIIHSTPRLLAIANLLLAGTYLLHSIVADFFLGDAHSIVGGNVGTSTATGGGVDLNGNHVNMVGIGGVGVSTSNRIHRSGRERLGGYLLFKLLLISAVVEPDTLDLLILLSWYTLLSFLKSLSFLAGVTTAHAAASGQMPHNGVCKLLIIVLICDISAAATCTALFHAAGWGMVILLTCDCALLALDGLTHLMRYFQQVIDERHQAVIADMEARQIRMFEMSRNEMNSHGDANYDGDDVVGDLRQDFEPIGGEDDNLAYHENNDVAENENDPPMEIHVLSRQLDHEMEVLEATNSKRLAILDNIAFILEICALMITTCHFMHIWSLHGVAFNLVDGVLALHLHSAVSAIGKKITERRNHNRIARDLDNFFEDVTDLELKKACSAGDVCCICLGTMSIGNVKKIGCGHIYHTNCLREVVERARSFEGARCPLCRQSIVDGSRIPSPQSSGMPQPFIFGGFPAAGNNQDTAMPMNTGNRVNNVQQDDMIQNRNATGQVGVENSLPGIAQQNQNERALFRFSTEGILPAWLPLPAFSFEVVRRPPLGADPGGDNVVPPQMQPQQNIGNHRGQQQNQQDRQQQSFWRRLLILAGAIPMSPEEEASALEQLVDMFPQYERTDLLRELRERGSAEAVVESILTGIFSGVDRGGANDDNNVVEQEVIDNDEEVDIVNPEEEEFFDDDGDEGIDNELDG